MTRWSHDFDHVVVLPDWVREPPEYDDEYEMEDGEVVERRDGC